MQPLRPLVARSSPYGTRPGDGDAARVASAASGAESSVWLWGAQINKQFNSFVKRVQQDVWERDFGCAAPCCHAREL